jgi:hypothetical protein
MSEIETITLWRPVGPAELGLIKASGMRAFPPRLPEQPIFYPVTTEEYAVKIARDWNKPESGSGYVTRFEVRQDFLSAYQVQEAGGRAHREYWIPAEDLNAFNEAIVGLIEISAAFPPDGIDHIHELAGGEIVVWVAQGSSIHIRTENRHGDPVEMNEHEAQELVDVLTKLIREIT